MRFKGILFLFLFTLPAFAANVSLQVLEDFVRSHTETEESEVKVLQPGCGFGRMLDLRQHWRELSPGLQVKAQQLLQARSPSRQKQITSPGGHFIIHYDTSGYHAVPLEDIAGNGIPDYIDSAAAILEHVWDVEINQLGFNPPPDINGLPVSTYSVYFTRMSDYGITWLVDEIKLGERTVFTSYLELNTSYSDFYTKGLDGMRVTAAHEFNHAIQLGYNVWLTTNYDLYDRFLMEMTSTWMEDYVYNDINDYYQYLYFLFKYLDSYSFNSPFNLYPYANSLYLHMTCELYGPGFTVDVWKRIIKEKGMQALETVLNNLGETFAESENRYGVWLYFTGDRAIPGAYFPEAADYPMLETVKKGTPFTTMLPGYGLNLFEIDITNNRLYQGGVSAGSGKGRINHILNGVPFKESISFGKVQRLEYNANMQKPVAVISNASEQKAESIHYDIQEVVMPPPTNPVIVYEQQGIPVFKAVPQNSEIRIYDILGRLVQKLHNSSSNSISWNLKSMAGNTVSSGLYLYFIDTGTQLVKGKFTVLR